MQYDGHNCGIFVIYYVFTIVSKSHFDKEFNPTEYRNYLKRYLLENSEDMTEICLYCNRLKKSHRCDEDQKFVQWVACTCCGRWMATNCIPTEDKIENYEKSVFLCLLCKKNNE